MREPKHPTQKNPRPAMRETNTASPKRQTGRVVPLTIEQI